MKLRYSWIASTTVAVLSASAVAAADPASGTSVIDKITRIETVSGEGYRLYTASAPHQCGSGDKTLYYILNSATNAVEMYRLVNVSMFSRRDVVLNWDCVSGQARITQVSSGSE
jgi:hypothetical protein